MFCKHIRLKINFDKTQVVWIGSKKFSTSAIKTKWKLSWGANKFKVLGIIFNIHVDIEQMIKDNYKSKLKHLENITKRWGKRALTPLGKITIIKTFLISAFNHLFLSLPNPHKKLIDHINNIQCGQHIFTLYFHTLRAQAFFTRSNIINFSILRVNFAMKMFITYQVNFAVKPAFSKVTSENTGKPVLAYSRRFADK